MTFNNSSYRNRVLVACGQPVNNENINKNQVVNKYRWENNIAIAILFCIALIFETMKWSKAIYFFIVGQVADYFGYCCSTSK